jgi:ABC-type polysaccharide/polyol phosphate transport system ATPase subunit
MSRAEIDAAVPSIIDFAEIGDHINVPMKYYSSGMISRLSFAIVLAMQPDILLIDEIFSVGDLAFQKKSERAMHDLLRRASCQVLVSHNLSLVKEHCTRAVYMRSGGILACGTPAEVVARYEADTARLSKISRAKLEEKAKALQAG